ncbi:MAG: hypothetical protein ABW066_08310 [Sedimenticola sp.]
MPVTATIAKAAAGLLSAGATIVPGVAIGKDVTLLFPLVIPMMAAAYVLISIVLGQFEERSNHLAPRCKDN